MVCKIFAFDRRTTVRMWLKRNKFCHGTSSFLSGVEDDEVEEEVEDEVEDEEKETMDVDNLVRDMPEISLSIGLTKFKARA